VDLLLHVGNAEGRSCTNQQISYA